jgi:hypothetical protein
MAGCGGYFGSERGFDRHRIGEVGSANRRCMTAAELAAAGWDRDERGFWLQPDPRRAGAAISVASQHLAATHGAPSPAGPPDRGQRS